MSAPSVWMRRVALWISASFTYMWSM